MILHKLERIDAKIDHFGVPATSPQLSRQAESPRESIASTPISFSAHRMIDWPAIRELLPASLTVPSGDYSLRLEEQRPPLPTGSHAEGFLADLSISVIRELSDAYFATFNLIMPILDRNIYFQRTLGTAINGGFGYDADSCIVLMTMALGCWGAQAVSDTSPLSNGHNADHEKSLAFYNEARKRTGFLECDHSMEICQFYLLSAVYAGQLVRPVDCWSYLMRAGTCCLKFWSSPGGDDWTLDMYSRLFWINVMLETVLTQEMTDLPTSKIREMEDQVPLPKFVQPFSTNTEDDDSFYHYHFLSQIAHRMFLTRVYNSSYYSSKSKSFSQLSLTLPAPSGEYPNPVLSRELYHQLDRWRSQLPPALRFDDSTPDPDPEILGSVLVVCWLRARYSVARYHLGRPFL